jgi:hypothetical protein
VGVEQHSFARQWCDGDESDGISRNISKKNNRRTKFLCLSAVLQLFFIAVEYYIDFHCIIA